MTTLIETCTPYTVNCTLYGLYYLYKSLGIIMDTSVVLRMHVMSHYYTHIYLKTNLQGC